MTWYYFYTFLQSNLLEIPIYLLFLRLYRSPITLGDGAIKITFMNSITHPIVFFVLTNMGLSYLAGILVAEAFAIGSEALYCSWALFPQIGRGRALFISATANLVSWQVAPILTFVILGPG